MAKTIADSCCRNLSSGNEWTDLVPSARPLRSLLAITMNYELKLTGRVERLRNQTRIPRIRARRPPGIRRIRWALAFDNRRQCGYVTAIARVLVARVFVHAPVDRLRPVSQQGLSATEDLATAGFSGQRRACVLQRLILRIRDV